VKHVPIAVTAGKNYNADFHIYLGFTLYLIEIQPKYFIAKDYAFNMGQIRDIMEKNVITIGHDKTVLDAACLMKENEISFLVVLKNEEPIGVVTESDFVRKLVANDKVASKVPLSEIMSYKFRSVGPSTEIEDAVQKMLNNKIRRLLVVDDGKLVGVITQTDLTSFLRSKLLIEGTVENLTENA
jgi:CBS domain-containing protein